MYSVLCKCSECSSAELPSGSGQKRLRSSSRGPWHTSLPRAVERNVSTQLPRSPEGDLVGAGHDIRVEVHGILWQSIPYIIHMYYIYIPSGNLT